MGVILFLRPFDYFLFFCKFSEYFWLNNIDRQPRRYIYLKDGGRFDAPKILRLYSTFKKMFYWQAKSSAKTPQIHNLWGVKSGFIYPKDGMDKNCSKTSVGVHWTLKWQNQ